MTLSDPAGKLLGVNRWSGNGRMNWNLDMPTRFWMRVHEGANGCWEWTGAAGVQRIWSIQRRHVQLRMGASI